MLRNNKEYRIIPGKPLAPIVLSPRYIVWQHIYDLLVKLDGILDYAARGRLEKFTLPATTAQPSIISQVVFHPVEILDPYLLALSRNYYYPLFEHHQTMTSREMEQSDTLYTITSAPTSPKTKPAESTKITVEHSIEAITDLLKEMEADKCPTQQQEAVQVDPTATDKPTYHHHRFAIYRRNNGSYTIGSPTAQLNLFKTFAKCIKPIDHQAQILPVRSNLQIHPISTKDQINTIEHVGIPHYFKAYKKTKKTLSGDFHIGSRLSFQEHSPFLLHVVTSKWIQHHPK